MSALYPGFPTARLNAFNVRVYVYALVLLTLHWIANRSGSTRKDCGLLCFGTLRQFTTQVWPGCRVPHVTLPIKELCHSCPLACTAVAMNDLFSIVIPRKFFSLSHTYSRLCRQTLDWNFCVIVSAFILDFCLTNYTGRGLCMCFKQ